MMRVSGFIRCVCGKIHMRFAGLTGRYTCECGQDITDRVWS